MVFCDDLDGRHGGWNHKKAGAQKQQKLGGKESTGILRAMKKREGIL